ncbi:hypothetical protein DY000_02015822 [Brassica cretica]|uniref:Uncharacterized protein n=1 Tax=Brassica cretica TaxID=69181 RepID=A0ABQ7CWB6_BRACR|nr:hypothetical protein DY000_02015822 [Brassica cretica]
MEGSPYQKFSISRRMGGDPGTGPGKFDSGEPELLLAGILGTGVPSSGDSGNRGSFQRGSRGLCSAWGLEEFNT